MRNRNNQSIKRTLGRQEDVQSLSDRAMEEFRYDDFKFRQRKKDLELLRKKDEQLKIWDKKSKWKLSPMGKNPIKPKVKL